MSSAYAKTMTVHMPSTGQTNFPARVSVTDADLRSTYFGGHVRSRYGYDIRYFSDAACTTELPHEDKFYDERNGRLVATVKVPNTATPIYCGFGDAGVSATTEDPANVFDSHFKLALRFKGLFVPPTRLDSNIAIDRNSQASHVSQVYDPGLILDPLDATKVLMFFSGMAAPTQTGVQAIFRASASLAAYIANPNDTAIWTETTGPIIQQGAGGAWDHPASGEGIRFNKVIRVPGTTTLRIYYSAADSAAGTGSCGIWTSTDSGVTGTKYASNPIIHVGMANSGAETGNVHFTPECISATEYHGIYGYYAGADPAVAGGRYASSSDGITWTKSGSGDRISKGPAGSDDAFLIEWFDYFYFDGYFYLGYSSTPNAQPGASTLFDFRAFLARSATADAVYTRAPCGAIVAESHDGSTWDSQQVSCVVLSNIGGEWRALVSGTDTRNQTLSNWQLGFRFMGRQTPADAFQALPALNDSTGNANNFTGTNLVLSGYAGLQSDGLCGDGSTRYASRAGLVIPRAEGQISAWYRMKGDGTVDYMEYLRLDLAGPKVFHIGGAPDGSGGTAMYGGFYNNAAGTPEGRVTIAPNPIADRGQHKVELLWTSGVGSNIYIDGVLYGSKVGLDADFDTTSATSYIARIVGVPANIDVDLLRISDIRRSAAWRAAEMLAESDNATFLTWGALTPLAVPSTGVGSSAIRGSAVLPSAIRSSAIRPSAIR